MNRKLFTVALMCVTSFAGVAVPANAAVTLISSIPAANPGAEVLDGMQDTCDAAAAAHDTGNGDIWTGEVVLGAVTLASGPTEVGSTSDRDIDLDTVVGTGFHPSETKIMGDPVRNGGSVNMFGHLVATAGYYDSSTYEFNADFETTYDHAFSCDIFNAVFHGEQIIHHPAVGVYVIAGDFGDSEDAIRGNCAAFTAQGSDPLNLPSWWGDPYHGGNPANPHCMFQGTAAYDETIDAYNDPPAFVVNEPQTAINVSQTDNLRAFEDAGSGYEVTGEMDLGLVVVCISPASPSTGKKGVPGAWRQQNGYTGDKCTTAWFNGGAMTGVTNLNLQGTFISVPPV